MDIVWRSLKRRNGFVLNGNIAVTVAGKRYGYLITCNKTSPFPTISYLSGDNRERPADPRCEHNLGQKRVHCTPFYLIMVSLEPSSIKLRQ